MAASGRPSCVTRKEYLSMDSGGQAIAGGDREKKERKVREPIGRKRQTKERQQNRWRHNTSRRKAAGFVTTYMKALSFRYSYLPELPPCPLSIWHLKSS